MGGCCATCSSPTCPTWRVVHQFIVHHFLIDELLPLVNGMFSIIHTVVIWPRGRLGGRNTLILIHLTVTIT